MPAPSTLNKKERRELVEYLENAHGTHMSGSDWETKWNACHGEGRTASQITFHIEYILTSDGDHKSRIKSKIGVLAGSEINWKQKCPSFLRMLNVYKAKYGVEITTSESSSNNEEQNKGKAWQHKVMKADDGSFFYLDDDDVFHACNSDGEDL